MQHPDGRFRTPQELYDDADLTIEQKRHLLKQWYDQILQQKKADEEGMLGQQPETSLQSVADLLEKLKD